MTQISILPYNKELHIDQVIQLILDNDFECGDTLPDMGFVALYDHVVVGYVGGYKSYGVNAFINMLVVNEAAREMKIGMALCRAMLNELRALGIQRFEAIVHQDSSEAIKLYNSLGINIRFDTLVLDGLVNNVIRRIDDYDRANGPQALSPSSGEGCELRLPEV